MTARQRSILVHALFLVIGTVAVMIALGLVYRLGHAHAQGLVPSTSPAAADDPVSYALQFYDAIRSGKGTVAIGVAAMLAVWGLRNGLGSKWAWFKTPVGGYVLGFSIPALLYFGTALAANAQLTMGLVLNAAGAAWVAAGGWEHFRDLLTAKPAPEPAK